MKLVYPILFLFFIASIPAFGQMVTYKDKEQSISIPKSVLMCNVEIMEDVLKDDAENRFWCRIDYGRLGTLVDEKGTKKHFKTIIGIYNYMAENGWEYISGDLINNDLGRDKHQALFRR